MLNILRHLFLWAAVCLLVISLSMLAATFSTSYKKCEATNRSYASSQEEINFQYRIGTFIECEAVFANENGPAVSGIATAILTVVTGLLVWLAYDQGKTSRAQLRAYVMVSNASVSKIAVGENPVAKIKLKNFGQTPAYKVAVSIGMGSEDWPLKSVKWPVWDHDTPAKRNERPLGPSDEFTLPIDLGDVLSQWKFEQITDGKRALWVDGKITYRDIFDKRWETNFCLITFKDVGVGVLAAYEERNTMT